jgi:hypothetical protein
MDGFLFVVLPIIITLYIQGFSFSHALPAATGKKEEKELFGAPAPRQGRCAPCTLAGSEHELALFYICLICKRSEKSVTCKQK